MLTVGGILSVASGTALIIVACYYLFYGFPKIVKKKEMTISMTALKFSYLLGIGGLFLLFLGVLNYMNVIPWWS